MASTSPLRFLVALLFPLVVSALHAQQPDIRISPDDRGYRMRPDALFQTADSAGGSVAVVWGTTEMVGGKPKVADYVQAIRNGAVLGPALRVGPTDGELGSHIRIAPFLGNFIILYEDAAPGEGCGTWSQILRLAPYRLEAPHRISSSLRLQEAEGRNQVRVIGSMTGEHHVLWYTHGSPYAVTPGLYGCSMSTDGIPGPVVFHGGYDAEILSYDALPNLLLIYNPAGRSSVVHRDNGRFDPRPLVTMAGPFHLGRDTSLALLDSTGTITLYRSLFDSAAVISRKFPLDIWGGSPEQMLISRDEGGVMLYLVIGESADPSWGTRPTCLTLRVRLDPDLLPLATERLALDSIDGPASTTWSVLGYTRSVSCDNLWRLGVIFGRNGSPVDTHYVALDERGMHPGSPDMVPRCGERAPVPVSRIMADSASIVEVGSPTPLLLSLPVARTTPSAHSSPAVTVLPSGIFCSWHEIDTATSDVLARWVQGADTMTDREVYVPPAVATYELQPYMIPQPLVSFSEVNDNAMRPLPGMAALEYNYSYTADVDGYYGKGRVRGSRFALARPGDKGWKTVATWRSLNRWITAPYNLAVLTGKVMGYDPGARSILVAISVDESGYLPFNFSFHVEHLEGYDEEDTTYWSVTPTNFTYKSWVILMGRMCYLTVTDAHATYFRSSTMVDSFPLPTTGRVNRRFFKLLGPTFAMTSWSDTDSLRFAIEIFDTLGNRLHAASVRRPATSTDYTLVQSPADSAIAILFGREQGLHATLLNGDLGIIAADTLLSQGRAPVSAPNGAFRNDTLFMVWEDHREAQSRIYGTRTRIRSMPSAGVRDEARPPRADGMRLYPNPTDGTVTIEGHFGDAGETTVDIITPLGAIARTRTLPAAGAGEVFATLDIGELPAGICLVRVRHGSHASVEKIVKR